MFHHHLRRSQIFFVVVALFAARDNVSAGGLPAADDRNDMVHGQFFRRELFLAIIANPGGELLLPPGRGAHFSGFCPFPGNMRVIFLDIDPVV